MTVTLYNTLTRKKEPFQPIDPGNVRMYVCGPTVYDYAHIGNARPIIVFDVLFRLLRHTYGEKHVTYARNITDVEDKINARAAEEGISIGELTARTTKQFHADIAALGVLEPTVEPRATDHIAEMRTLIEALVANGNAYVAEEHVLFNVPSMKDYGRLSNRSLEEMEAGARVEVAPYKRDAMDFVLWKPSKAGEPSWPSPAGIATPGRPGWHIECSAMADRWLWQEAKASLSAAGLAQPHMFDIHGGGIDLVFPHHENEIAQSRCAHGTPVMAKVWMHNGFLQVEGEKMSKSLGNFVTINELLAECAGDVVRLNMLLTHYRQPIDWTTKSLAIAQAQLLVWAQVIADELGEDANLDLLGGKIDEALVAVLADDLNSPQAIARLHELFALARAKSIPLEDFVATARFLGLRQLNKPGYFHPHINAKMFESGPQAGDVEQKQILAYRSAVANGQMNVAETMRTALEAKGFELKVNAAGVVFVGNKTSGEMVDLENRLRVEVEALIAQRHTARKAKDFAEADKIREKLSARGIQLKDAKDPTTAEIVTTWEVKR